jgi:acetyl-CoA carboxylase carboxyltransferase component
MQDHEKRAADYAPLLSKLYENLKKANRPESAESIQLAAQRGKFTARERVERLIDVGAPILDIAPLAGLELPEGSAPGGGIITCLSLVAGRYCMIIANNPAVKGGTYFPITVRKHLRAQEVARKNRLPCIYLVDSGGAFLPLQDQVFPDREHFGRIFYNQANMSAAGIPQISVVLGSCTAGGAYIPAMSDETVIVRGSGTIFLGGPPLVKAATGEEVTAEELGGADVHTKISGVADHLAETELDALIKAREIIASLPPDSVPRLRADLPARPPNMSPREIPGIVGTDLRRSFSMRDLLSHLLDGSEFSEFKGDYGRSVLCGFGHIMGFRVGIVANDGILFSESALKATHFIELCNLRGVPLLFLQNITGFMVGKSYEHEGIAKHGAKMVTAVSTSRVPKFTIIIGGSFGAGNYGMCGRAYDPNFLFTWPASKISVMGGSQAANVLAEVNIQAKTRRGEPVDEAEIEKFKAEILAKYEREGDAFYATARMWDDGIIDPRTTREILAVAFAASASDPGQPYNPGLFRM